MRGFRGSFAELREEGGLDRRAAALKGAFPHTVPILTGFIFLGMAYGMLMNAKGFPMALTAAMSVFVFAGSMQYVAIPLLAAGFDPLLALLLTLVVNARHVFYGISMLERLKGAGRFKPYIIFALCDETFSVLVEAKPPEGVDKGLFMFFIALLNQSYWVIGSVLGHLAGAASGFDAKGLDFALTALFVVIFLGQWKGASDRRPALIGLGCTATAILAFGRDSFVLPAMAMILAALMLMRRPGEMGFEAGRTEGAE
jgi:4-azaleucine resistance transporter AzlC